MLTIRKDGPVGIHHCYGHPHRDGLVRTGHLFGVRPAGPVEDEVFRRAHFWVAAAVSLTSDFSCSVTVWLIDMTPQRRYSRRLPPSLPDPPGPLSQPDPLRSRDRDLDLHTPTHQHRSKCLLLLQILRRLGEHQLRRRCHQLGRLQLHESPQQLGQEQVRAGQSRARQQPRSLRRPKWSERCQCCCWTENRPEVADGGER